MGPTEPLLPRRRVGCQRLAVGHRDPLYLLRINRNPAPHQICYAPRQRVIGMICIARRHVDMNMRAALTEPGSVDAERPGDLELYALEVPQRRPEVGRLLIVKSAGPGTCRCVWSIIQPGSP